MNCFLIFISGRKKGIKMDKSNILKHFSLYFTHITQKVQLLTKFGELIIPCMKLNEQSLILKHAGVFYSGKMRTTEKYKVIPNWWGNV